VDEGERVDEIGAHNREQFDAPDAVRDYEQMEGLTPCEAELFERHVAPGVRVLDLGVGAGRTTPWLRARASTYVGIDYAPGMVEAARRLHPDADLRVGDASDLAAFPDDAFEVVVFSYNGIDYLDDAGRGRVLDEVRRVLVPGGTYLFSTHNARAVIGRLPKTSSPLPRRVAAAGLMTLRRLRRMVPSSAFRTGEGWVLDPVKGGLRTHMATPARVEAELRAHGFALVERRNGDRPARPMALRTPWWYYACTTT
jgi:SAM-dependent methyltransferase